MGSGSLYKAERLNREIMRAILQLAKDRGLNSRQLATNINSHLSPADAKKRPVNSILRTIYYLRKQGLVKEKDNKTVVITKSGNERLMRLAISLNPLTLARNERWDGLWRIISFDIPEEKRTARDALRKVIKHIGFKQLQRSVWVHPLPCKEYIQEIQDAYGVKDHILYAEAKTIQLPSDIQRHFKHITNRLISQ